MIAQEPMRFCRRPLLSRRSRSRAASRSSSPAWLPMCAWRSRPCRRWLKVSRCSWSPMPPILSIPPCNRLPGPAGTCSVKDHLNITLKGAHSNLTNNVKHSSHDPKLCMCRHGSAFHHWQNQALTRHQASRRAKTGCTGCGKLASRLAVTAWKSTSLPGG